MDNIRRNQNSVKNWLALIIIIAGFCLAYPSTAEAAVQVDAVSSDSTTGISITIPHTTSGSNRLMLVGVSFNNDNLETVTGITYNSVPLTLVGTATNSDDARIEIWRLIAPDTGTYDVVVTFSADLLQEGFAGVVTFTGVDQTTPLGTFASAAADGITATVDVSSATGELVFDTVATEYPSSISVGAGQTERWNIVLTSSIGAGSTEPGAGTVTMSWTLEAAGDHWAIGAVPIKPAPDGTLTLANHTYGQVSDRFRTTTPVTDVLYRLRLTRTGTATVDNLRVNFTTGGGVANSDVSNGELWEDVDNDSVVDDPGDTLIQGSVTPSSGVLTFTNNFSPGTGGTRYLVRATVSNLTGGDTTTFSVGTADIDEVENVTESGSISNATHTQDSSTFTTNYRSIGTNTGTLYNTGNASISSGTTTVTFGGGASLPEPTAVGAVGVGDELVIGAETFYILSRDSDTQVTVQSAATSTHSDASYTITRAYNDIQTWENARDGNLVSNEYVEVGVCYKDGPFLMTGETRFDDSITDSTHYMHLTVAEGQRHNGTAGTGVVVDGQGGVGTHLFNIRDPYTRLEWLEITNIYDNLGQPIITDNPPDADGSLIAHILLHDYSSDVRGINIYGSVTVRNCILYDGDVGIRMYEDYITVTMDNNTVYNISGDGFSIRQTANAIMRNNISVGCGGQDFDIDSTVTVLPSSGNNLYSTVDGGIHPGTNNQSPPGGGLEDLFISITPDLEDLHIESCGHDALGNGQNLSGSFTDDIDGETRSGLWDIGADEVVCDYSFRRPITIQSSQVSGSSDFTDFPVLISLSGNWLKTTTADPINGRIENANGYDIIFKDSTGATQLDHEIERYDGSASGGTLVAWVRIPTLSYNTDTVIYMYYGSGCICSSQENITGVWDSDYVAVWHFKESSGTVYDSTSNDNDGSPQGTPSHVDAKIGKAYNTTSGYFSVPYSSSLDFVSGSMYIECWVKYDDFAGGTDPGIFVWNNGDTDMFGMNDPTTPRFRVSSTTLEAGTASAATWYYYVGRYTGSNMYTYHNTSQLGNISKSGNTAFANGTNTIGYRSAYTSYINGIIDELRISKIDRGVDYMTTTYNNQNSPASFYNEGSEEDTSDVWLAEHAAGQEADKFGLGGSVAGAELFAFKLINNTASQVTVSEVQFQLSSVSGIVQGDFSSLEIYVDDNNDGTIDVGEITTVGGSGTVDAGVATITFGTDFNISASGTVNYILKGDVSNLAINDTVTIGLGTSNVTLASGTMGGSAPTSVTHTRGGECIYYYSRQITIDNTKVSGTSDLTNFPALIDLSGDWLKTVAADPTNGRIQNVNGYDIIFKDTGGTQLDHEVESYDGSASGGTLVAWVRIPTLSYDTDTVIYMYYGNSCISTSQENITGVWNSNYKGVWHLKETPTVDSYAYDSTSMDNDGTFQNMESDGQVAGKINGSLEFISTAQGENISEAIATTDTTTTSSTYTALDSMSITPGAGDYIVWFSGSVGNNVSTNQTMHVSLFVNGSQVTHTEREILHEESLGGGSSFPVASHAYISGVGAGEAIDVRWKTTGGTATMHERTLVVKAVDSANVSQATATADYTINTGGVDALVGGMTVTPGAGDYLVYFSSSAYGNSTGFSSYLNLYVNGVKVPHTEREFFEEGSCPNSSYPIMFQALVTGVGAGEAIEVWGREDSGSTFVHERTLVVEKITASDASQASATADTTTTSATYTAVNSMSINAPEAGDYLVWFSSSISNSLANLTEYVSLFVNGTQVAHTEREIFVEGSLAGGNSFPVALHARVTGVGAGQAIDVRWMTTAGTATLHDRTLVIKKDTIGGSDFVDLDSHIGDYAALAVGSISIWFKYTDTTDFKILFSASCNTDDNSDLDIMYYPSDDVFMTGVREDGTNVWNCSFPANYADGSWHHYVMTVDGSGNNHYIDGSQITGNYTYGGSASTQAFFNSVTGLNTLRFGNREDWNGNQYHFGGNLDEVRISNIALSADWIQTEHNNQSDPATFYTVGNQECEYSYSRTITIQSSEVSGTSDLTNFPALISLSGDWLKTVTADPANGRIENSSGYDIIFKDTGGTQLDHEIESYDGSASGGTLVAWVRIPTLYYNTDTVIYMYYGNSCVSSSQENAAGVWDSNFKGVWHLGESSGSAQDSTSYGTSGSVSGTVTQGSTGNMDGAYDFYTSGQVDCGDPVDGHLDGGTGSFTVSLWVNIDANRGTWEQALYKGGSSEWNYGYSLELHATQNTYNFIINDGGAQWGYSKGTSFTVDTWHHIVGVVDRASNLLRIYKDGTEQGTATDISSVGNIDSADNLAFSKDWGWIDGLLDEVRISDIARSADWIQTEFNNQNDPSNFYNVGNEEVVVGVSLAEHDAGQETDQFGSTGSVSGAELFGFKLTNSSASQVTVDSVQFQLSSVTGILQGDFANLEIYVDNDNDGTIEAGETATVGGPGVVNAGVTTITFSTDFNISASSTVNYILKGDVTNLVGSDTVTIDLGTGNVTLSSGSAGGAAPTSVTHTSDVACEYSSWRQITIDNTKVSGTSDLTNFPLLVSLSGDWLKTTTADPTSGRITNSNGYDIIFKDTSGTQLDHEIEDYDGTNGTLVAWVRIPTLSYDTDTVIYMYYGNPCISTSQENITGVWDSNYKGVWHLKETPTVDSYAYDSTSNDNDGSFEASMTSADQVTGKVNGALDFEGTDDYVDAGSGASLVIYNSDFTWEAWAKLDAKAQDREIISKAGDEVTVFPIELRYDVGEDNWQFNVNDGAWQYAKYTQASPLIDTWYHVVGVRDGSTIRIYINGVEGAVTDTTGTLTDSSAFSLFIGRLLAPSDPRHFDGQIDEARVSNIVRSADWILTEYNNQNDPSSFYSVGEEGTGCSYSYRKSITIQSSQVSGTSDLSSFPVLVSLTNGNLRHIDSGGHVTNINGYDIIFRASDETTQLDHEIEEYDSSTGTVVAWVRIPTVSYDTNTVIYMYYGNTCISSSQENVIGVWSNNYVAVWHLSESPTDSSPAFKDSTSNNNDGTDYGSMTSGDQVLGQIDGSLDFDGSDDYLEADDSSSLRIPGSFTVSAWINTDDLPSVGDLRSVVGKGMDSDNPGENHNYGIMLENTILTGGSAIEVYYEPSTGFGDAVAASWVTSLSTGQWYHVVGVHDAGADTLTLFVNAVQRAQNTGATATPDTGSAPLRIGDVNVSSYPNEFNGRIDEVRISDDIRSAGWIITSYNNQNTPSSFYNEGTEESAGTLSLGNHAAGQEEDKFATESSVTGAELFAFKLTNTTDSTVTVKKVLFPLSAVTGISQGDFANLELYVDANNDGTIGGGETTTVGGTGAVNAGVTDITFSTDFTISANTTVNYILKGDVSNLAESDTVTIDLGTSNITITAGHVGGSVPTSATHTSDVACEYSSWRQITIDNTKVGGSSSTNTWQVAANERDAWDDSSSGSLNGCDFGDSVWYDAGGYQWAVTIPQGATIISAKLKVYSTSHGGATGAYTARIRIEDVDNASAFDGTPNDIYGRSYWGTTVDWNIPSAGLPTGTWTDSPDITDLVQQVVNRPGWSSGNYLSIAVWGQTGNGGSNENINDFSADQGLATRLEVTYQDGSGSHQDFPLLVSLSGDWLKTTTVDTTNGRIQNGSGYDIIFKDTSGTQLDHEIEDYDGTNGTLVAWVRIPALSYDVDTVIYIYYGNPCISSSQENVTGIWDSNYVGVWHLKESGDGSIDEYKDSTQYTNHGRGGEGDSLFVPTQVSGKISYGQDFNNSDGKWDLIDCGSDSELDITGTQITLEAWIKYPSATHPYMGFLNHKGWDNGYRIIMAENSQKITFQIPGSSHSLTTQQDISTNVWHHFVATYDGITDQKIRIYIDGIKDTNELSKSDNILSALPIGVWIGHGDQPKDEAWSYEWQGQIDEMRISDTARTADWIQTEYNNQNDPSTFYSVGNEGAGCSYSHKREITIQASEVSGSSDLSNFPVAVNLTDNALRHIDSGGHVANTNGYDIVFRASDEITQLDHEIEEYDATSGTLVAWVRIPTLSYNADTVIYMYYGNTCISSSQENVTGVWDSNFVGVWHLKEEQSGSTADDLYQDSTSNNNDGDDRTDGTAQNGKINGGQQFSGDGDADYVQIPHHSSLNLTGDMTISFWMYATENSGVFNRVVDKGYSTSYYFGGGDGTNDITFYLSNTEVFDTADSTFTINNWHYAAVTYDSATGDATLILDGNESGSGNYTGGITGNTDTVYISHSNATYDFAGYIDEVRISNTDRSVDWLKTEHNNQSTPSNFYTDGGEETAGTVTLGNHAAGQETDNFDEQTSLTGVELFAFKLTNTTDSTVNVKKVQFQLSSVTGIAEGDFSNLYIYVDTDNDGTKDAGETTAVGGMGEVNAGVTDITFSDNFTISATTAVNYILVGDVSNLMENDTVTIDLNPTDVTITAGYVTGSAPTSATHTTDGQCTFSYRRPITIQASQVSGTADLTDFPVVISLSGTWLRTSTDDPANGHVENSNGYDIIFRASDGKTQLDHEIEDYDGSATGGTLVAWVRIPTLDYNDDTVIYMLYGNSCIDSSTENVTGVWDSDFKAVWHLKEDPSGTPPQINDSTSTNSDGTTGGAMISGNQVAGKLNGSVDFEGTDDYVTMPNTGFNTSAGTVGAWVNIDAFPASSCVYVFSHCLDSPVSDRTYIQLWTDNTWGTGMGDTFDLVRGSALNIDTWYHLAITWDGTNVRGYLNGNLDFGPTSYTGLTTVRDIFVMAWNTPAQWVDGTLDELRLSSTDRSADWIKTEYNNQNDPSTFCIIGNEETPVPTAVDLIYFTATGKDDNVLVEWETAQEVDNLGFNLYRSTELGGTYSKLNRRLIPGLLSSVTGKQYTYVDKDVIPSVLYFYMLEDVDLDGTRTMHGPICVDWDGDGTPDDYIEDPDDDADTDTGEEDPDVSIPDTGFDELESDLTDWTPSSVGGSASWVKLSSFNAYEQDEGVALEWETSYEIDNLGFHIYRELDGKFYRITPDLVPGSVFSVGEGSELPAGQSYAYWDALSKQTGREFYWLDSIELNGGRASFGPIEPEISGKPIPKGRQARYESIADYQVSKAKAAGKARMLREAMSTVQVREQKSRAIFYEIVPDNTPTEPRLPPSEEQWALSAQPGVKIYVKEDGWYRVGEPELVAAGLTPGIDPRYLQLYADGLEQSILVTGDEDGRFDPSDAVEFYGTGLNTPFTDAHVYWLVVGSRPGRRLDTPFTDIRVGPDKGMRIPRGLRGRGASLSFLYTEELKERTFYFAALKTGERENFFGSVISTDPVDQLLTLANLGPSSPRGAMLEVGLQGGTDVYHQVRILLNYTDAYDVGFAGQLGGRVEIPISQGSLLEGDNVVTLTAQGGSMDISLVDYVRITYWRTYAAEDDILMFTANGGEWLSIGGFSTPGIRVVDITDPVRILDVRGKVKADGSDYAITIKVPSGGERTLLAFTEENIKQPAGIAANLVSSWHELSQGADVVIIGHSDLLESVRPLKELREQQGLSVVLVDVEDLYDEFNFGAKSPWAVKDFLARAYRYWASDPRYLILVGDTSYDPRNYLGYGEFDLMPTKFVDTAKLKTASDDWFVDFNDDELPEMAVGRLPAASAEEATAVVAKIINYEGYAGFMNEVLLVSDTNDFFNFEQACTKVAELIPGNLSVNEIFRGRSATARADLLDLLNQGQLLVNYFGHGSTQMWNGNLLTYSDVWNLTNSPNLPFFISTTCLNGFFHDPYSESLAEGLLKAPLGGAVAVWTSSGLTDPEEQVPMNEELIRLLFNVEGLTIGEAIMGAKHDATDRDVRRTWILFGDPTLKLR